MHDDNTVRGGAYTFRFEGDDQQRFACQLECMRCTAVSASTGRQCKRRSCIGTPLCWSHLLKERHVRIKASTVAGAGKGLFAAGTAFKKGDVIVEYAGERLSAAQVVERYGRWTGPYVLQVSRDVFMDAACQRGDGSLINHARGARANAKFAVRRGQGVVLATRRIQDGQEIFVDYGPRYNLREATRSRTMQK